MPPQPESRSSAAAAHEIHAYFRRERCGLVFCLADVRPAAPGFRGTRTDLNVRGFCPACAEP